MRSSSRLTDDIINDYVARRIYWHGRITRKDLVETFDVGPAKASRLLTAFRNKYSEEVLENGKGYVLIEDFCPTGVSGASFLNDLLAALYRGADPTDVTGECPPAIVSATLVRQVRTEVLKEIVAALRNREAATIKYVGMKLGERARARTVEPVELVHIHDRWHVHAFCYEAEDWRDFVLSRILEVIGRGPARYKWLRTRKTEPSSIETLTVVPHPALTEDQKAAVEFEFGMDEGKLALKLPQNELFYFLQRYVAGSGEGPPQKLLVQA